MSWIRTLSLAASVSLLVGCGAPQSEYDQLKAENTQLKQQIDELLHGEARTIGEIEQAYEAKAYVQAKNLIIQLRQKHPESTKNKEYASLETKIDRFIDAQRREREAKEKEERRLANLNNLGMWSIEHFVDNFGDATKQSYITNTGLLSGTFSNTATQNSPLDVKFLFESPNKLSIQLYEYAGNNPVKDGGYNNVYDVLVKDKDDKRYHLKATNYSDRLTLESDNARQLHSAFMKGGRIQFLIRNVETSTSQYEFTVENADYYNNAVEKQKSM